MESTIKKYCTKYNISTDKFYKVCGVGIVSIYGLKVSYPFLKKCLHNFKQHALNNDKDHQTNGDLFRSKLQKKIQINHKFLQDVRQILRIIIPSLYSIEAGLLSVHTCTLVARTFLSVYVASLESNVVKYIVRRDVNKFGLMLMKWLLVAVPATFINSCIRYLESQLALRFRSHLTKYSYDLYFKNETYYRIGNLDNRIDNIDQCLTEDLSEFSSLITHLYSRLTKPLIDIAVICFSMYKLISRMKGSHISGPLISSAIFWITGILLSMLSPQFNKLIAIEADKKGQLRAAHSCVINNAEEIAFYRGHKIEMNGLMQCYSNLVDHKMLVLKKKLWYVMFEQFLLKYIWSAGGMIMIALPLMGTNGSQEISSRTQAFTFAKNLLTSAGDASERLLSSYKKILELQGYCSRILRTFKVLKDVSDGDCMKTSNQEVIGRCKQILNEELQVVNNTIIPKGHIKETARSIKFENVPIITPNYDVIIKSISFSIEQGMHVLITGPNGSGKSSLFRILSGLWPIYEGVVHSPPPDKICYIPLRPYLSNGTLRDQIIYPHSLSEMKSKGISDSYLDSILDVVSLQYIINREGGWDSLNDWKDVLSGGEKQRIGMARLFYHQPQFALLDECTNAVSIDIESEIYEALIARNISLLTITHRTSLWKFHNHILKFDGKGGWTFDKMDGF